MPKKLDPKQLTLRYIVIKMARPEDKERILNATRNAGRYKGALMKNYYLIFIRNVSGLKRVACNIQGDEKQGTTSKATLSSKAII